MTVMIAFGVGIVSGPLGIVLIHQYTDISLLPTSDQTISTVGTLQQSHFYDEETATMHVVASANPAVVSIGVYKEVTPQLLGTMPLYDWFGGMIPFDFREENVTPQIQRIGGGSGFLITPDGLIVTNRHVVDDTNATYTVVLSDGTEYDATVIARDPYMDIALLDIEVQDAPILKLGDSEALQLGQTVIAIGNALDEFGNSVTRGVISGVGRRVEAGNRLGMTEVIDEAIQTDAAINPGNSGGPLLNLAGEVIGINTAVSREGQLVGFAIPIHLVRQTIESVRTEGRIIRPFLGIRYVPVTPRLAEQYGLPVTYGALIVPGAVPEAAAVLPGSPADQAGLTANMIILAIDDVSLDEKDSLSRIIARYTVGDTIRLRVLDGVTEREISVTLTELPTDDYQ